jgi:cytoskeletal protein RodZ
MKKALKRLGGLLVVVVVAVITKMKVAAFFAVKAFIVMALHMVLSKDSTTTAGARPRPTKPQRQVAQTSTPKPNLAEQVAGPNAPAPSGGPAHTPSAPLGAGPIQAARNAAAAQHAQLAKETGQDVPPPKGARPATPPPAAPTQTAAAPSQSTPVVQQGAPTSATNTAAPNARPANANAAESNVMRESFDYTRDTRRDPFVSLMTTSDLRPTLTDLRLTGILYDLSGRRPVAILRDIAGGQWRVTTGMTLGRMRVAQIKPKTIIFTIEEFGFNRQDSLILGDTTRVRHR